MELKDRLIKEVAFEKDLPESTVEKIISFQFKDGNHSAKIVKEIEFSGLGKFVMSIPKARKRLEGYQNYLDNLPETDPNYAAKKQSTTNYIEYLKSKI